MKYDAYFPMSWIYNADGELVGDLFLHCVFDIGTPSLDVLKFLAEQRGSSNTANALQEVEQPFIVNADPLQIPTPWKLLQWGWVHTCRNENIKYAEGSNATPLDEYSEMWKFIARSREHAYSFYVPYTSFAAGEFIQEEQSAYAEKDYTFSILVTPFTEAYSEGLYYSYAQRTISTQCPEPLMQDAVLLYKKSRTASPYFKRYMTRVLGGMHTEQRVENVTRKKTHIANLLLLRQMQAENKNQVACYQLMNNDDKAPYKVNVDTQRGTTIKLVELEKPMQLNAVMFDTVQITGEGLMQGTQVQLGEKTKKLYIGTTHAFGTLAYYKTNDNRNSCVSMASFRGKAPQLSTIAMVAAAPNDAYLKSIINMGIAGQTQLSLSIPYMLNCAPILDLRDIPAHCTSARIEFGVQPTDNIALGTAFKYRYGIMVTRPKCTVMLDNAVQVKHENKFSVTDRNLIFYIPTFSRSHTICVDTTKVSSGRHIISFVDNMYLYTIARKNWCDNRVSIQLYMNYLQEIQKNLQTLNLPDICADDEVDYFSNKRRCLTQVHVKIKTTTSILLSSALTMNINVVKAIKTLVLVELTSAVLDAEVHIYGDVETLRICANGECQYTYYVHGTVKNIISEENGFSRDSRVRLAPARGNTITVHVRPNLTINTVSCSGTETIFYCDGSHNESYNFGRLLPLSARDVSALDARFVLCDSKLNNAVKLIPDVR